jgi:hypothetical protein
MSADDMAGTIAAKIAVMTNHPSAVRNASELVAKVLEDHPFGDLGEAR